jgi:hypothetical protein
MAEDVLVKRRHAISASLGCGAKLKQQATQEGP